jgi:NADH-quinone oxidoreductase subunit L
MSTVANPLWLIPALPALGFLVNGTLALVGARTKNGPARGLSGFLGVLFPLVSFVLVALAWRGLFTAQAEVLRINRDLGLNLRVPGAHPAFESLWSWIHVGGVNIDFGFRFDELTGIMLLFITGIGTLIHLYSIGYMAHDRGFARFFSYLNLFMASMIVLVLGNGPLVTFLGWEGVGLCSYLLIGFWHHDAQNGAAAKKAFLVNRVGDLGFLLGLFLLWQIIGDTTPLTYEAIAAWFRDPAHASLLATAPVAGLLTASTLLLFLGCTGKSAQIPLLTWLPDAMAGPTPVSALIHAATMVTSGVFLLARLSDVFARAPFTLHVIAWVGAATAAWAAVTGLFQTDLKKILAYSTVSQLGYMFLAAGVGAFDAGIFHVFTHAFFKAVLFLGAGSVIHALSGEQDIRRMGGLWKKLPVTFAAMLAGWYAIAGLPFGAGFWSKDLILERVLSRGGPVLYGIALVTAIVTAVYMTRMMILVFWSSSRLDPETSPHVHESPLSMQIPLWILGAGSLVVGFAWADPFHIDWIGSHLADIVGPAQAFLGVGAEGPSVVVLDIVGVLAALLGIAVSFGLFRAGLYHERSTGPLSRPVKIWTLLFDGLHKLVGIWPVAIVAWILDDVVQPVLIAWVRIFAWIVDLLGQGVRLIQRSRLRVNLGLSILGFVLLLILLARDIL